MAVFKSYLPLLEAAEGGFQKLTGDNGNYNSLGQLVGTNYGVSAKVYELWLGYPPSESDMRNMSKTIANEIYKSWYWDKIYGNSIINQSVANILADHAVNAGVFAAVKLAQKTLNDMGHNLTVDGAMGANTLNAINSVNPAAFHDAYKEARLSFYESIGGEFLKAWKNRLKAFVYAEKKNLFPAC